MADNKKIVAFLKTCPEGATLSEIASRTGHGRATVGKYLELLKLQGKADFRGVGRAKVWFLTIAKKPKIVIVDDEPGLLKLLRLTFGEEEYEIIEAGDGLSAIEKVNENMPDAIILDLRLPKLDGMEVCKKLRENVLTKKIPIIMLTAKDELNSRIRGIKLGADDYVSKPFDVLELKERVKTFLQKTDKRNQVTNLPNLCAWKDELHNLLKSGDERGALRISFDNLDTYSKKMGKLKENEFLRVISQILTYCTLSVKDSFVGHISSQEFVVICGVCNLRAVSDNIQKSFDEISPYLSSNREKGNKAVSIRIKAVNRREDIEKMSLL